MSPPQLGAIITLAFIQKTEVWVRILLTVCTHFFIHLFITALYYYVHITTTVSICTLISVNIFVLHVAGTEGT